MTFKIASRSILTILTLLSVKANARLVEGDGTERDGIRGRKPAQVAQATRPIISENEVKERTDLLPTYKTQAVRETSNAVIANDLAMVKSQKSMIESRPGKAADSTLRRTKSGVAVFDLGKKISSLPLLNVGEEALMSRSEWQIQSVDIRISEFQSPKALDTPTVMSEAEHKSVMGNVPELVSSAKI